MSDTLPASNDLLWNYKTWLEMEHRFLSWELAGQDGDRLDLVERTIIIANPAGRFHQPSAPPPSTRAAAVLTAVGIDWGEPA